MELKFKIFNQIPVTIHPFFWVLALVIAWLNSFSLIEGAMWVFVVFASVLIHECGHALTAIWCGQKAKIELMSLGGVTVRSGERVKNWQEFLIILNGPIAGFILCGLGWVMLRFYTTYSVNPLLAYFSYIFMVANLFWTVLNLIPVQPLDGGKLVLITLRNYFGLRGIHITFLLSMLLAIGIAIFSFIAQLFIIGGIFLIMAYENFRHWNHSRKMTEHDQDEELKQLVVDLGLDMEHGRRQEAMEKIETIRSRVNSGMIYITATENLARLLVDKKELQEAKDILLPIKSQLSPDGLLILFLVEYHLKNWQEVVQLGDRVYKTTPSVGVAMLNAFSHSHLNNPRQAVGWLQSAVQQGVQNLPEILKQSEFDPIRETTLFQDFKNKITR